MLMLHARSVMIHSDNQRLQLRRRQTVEKRFGFGFTLRQHSLHKNRIKRQATGSPFNQCLIGADFVNGDDWFTGKRVIGLGKSLVNNCL